MNWFQIYWAPSSSLLKINHFPSLRFTEGMLVLYLLWMLCLESLPCIYICHHMCSHFLKRFEITLFHLLYHESFVSSGCSQVTKMFFPVKLRYFISWSFLEDYTSFYVFLSKKTSWCWAIMHFFTFFMKAGFPLFQNSGFFLCSFFFSFPLSWVSAFCVLP